MNHLYYIKHLAYFLLRCAYFCMLLIAMHIVPYLYYCWKVFILGLIADPMPTGCSDLCEVKCAMWSPFSVLYKGFIIWCSTQLWLLILQIFFSTLNNCRFMDSVITSTASFSWISE